MKKLSGVLAFVLSSVPGIVAAGDADETVYLKDGSIYRGELVEKVPGDHVTVKLATGEIKRFAWQDLATQPVVVERGPTQPAPPPPAPVEPRTRVELAGPPEIRLQTHYSYVSKDPQITVMGWGGGIVSARVSHPEIEGWTNVCQVPCGSAFSRSPRYRVDGNGIRASAEFYLPHDRHHLKLKVATASSTAFAGGLTLLIAGALSTVAGGAYYANGGLADRREGAPEDDAHVPLSIALIGGGAAAIVTGLVLLLGNLRTTVTDDTGKRLARAGRWAF
jgi:hypothetical protein